MKYIIYLAIIVIIAYLIKNKIKINIPSFFHKGFTPNRGIFGIYCYCGKQGTGKTYSVIEFLNRNKGMRIYANLTSIKGINYQYINGFNELLELRKEHDCIIFYDEIFTELTKYSKINKDVLDFLCQMRKRRILFLTTAQEWGEIPLTFRRYCRFQVNCSLIRIPLFGGLSIKKVMDAENLKWSQDDNDWVAPLIGTLISHTQYRIANSYDTFEQIGYNSNNLLSSFNVSDTFEDSDTEKEDISPDYSGELKGGIIDVSRETFEEEIDKEFWGKEEILTSLTGLRISDVNVNVKNE